MEILDTPNVNLWPKQLNNSRTRSKAYDAIPHIKLISSYVVKLNAALFFLGSPFYSLLNRLFRINYVSIIYRSLPGCVQPPEAPILDYS